MEHPLVLRWPSLQETPTQRPPEEIGEHLYVGLCPQEQPSRGVNRRPGRTWTAEDMSESRLRQIKGAADRARGDRADHGDAVVASPRVQFRSLTIGTNRISVDQLVRRFS